MVKQFEINGGVRGKKRIVVLTIYSMPFARYLLKNNIKTLNVQYNNSNFIISFGTYRKISFERVKEDNPLCVISITKLLPAYLKEKIKLTKKQKRVKVIIKNIITKKELLEYNNQIKYKEAENLKKYIPKNEKIKLACGISCFRNKSGFNYRLNIKHRILENIALKKEKVLICRDKKDNFIIRKNPKGNPFNFYRYPKGYPLAYMQISPSLIKEKENLLFKSGRRCFPSKIFLSSREFQLDISKFFMHKEERALAYALLNRNINVRIPDMRKREADIVLTDHDIQIEITTIHPRPQAECRKNSPHSEGLHINGRLCEGFLRVTRKIVPYYIVVFNKIWMKLKWVQDTCSLVEPRVLAITTNFKKGWENDVADKIVAKFTELGIIK